MANPSDDLSHLEITPEKIEQYRPGRGVFTKAESDAREQRRIAKQNRADKAKPRFELFIEELAELQKRFGVMLDATCDCWDCDCKHNVIAVIPDDDGSPLLSQPIEVNDG